MPVTLEGIKAAVAGEAADRLQVIFAGCICCYSGFKPKQFLVGCKAEGEELCLKGACCCAPSSASC